MPAGKQASNRKAKPAPESQLEKLIAKQKKTEKLLAAAKAKLLAKRNCEMLAEEDMEPSERPKKKAKRSQSTSSASASDSFGADDAAALNGLLGSDRVSVHADESEKGSDDESSADSAVIIDDDDNGEEEEDDDDELPTSVPNSDMIIDEPVTKKKKCHRRTTSKPRVTQSTFSPMSMRLANVGRHAVRVDIATKEGFPTEHADFAWTSMSDAVSAIQTPELVERLAIADKSDVRRAQLTSYAWGGASQVRGEIKALCKAAVGLFGIPGNYTPAQIATHVTWLIGKKGVFKFGGIDLETRTYDVQQPFGASFYKDVMTKQWFDTIKSEGVRTASFEHFIDAPVPALTIVTGGMENALKEWATGMRISIKFTEEEFAPRYQQHRAALLNLQAKSPTWFAQFQRDLYSKIVSTSNFPHLKAIVAGPEEDELDGVDFEALEASATAKNTEAV